MRGRAAFPADGCAETEPTSTKPNPIRLVTATASAFLSKPAASPTGPGKSMPATLVRRHGSRTTIRRSSAASATLLRANAPDRRSAARWLRSGSSPKSSGRTATR
jgi:hypothetical protein